MRMLSRPSVCFLLTSTPSLQSIVENVMEDKRTDRLCASTAARRKISRLACRVRAQHVHLSSRNQYESVQLLIPTQRDVPPLKRRTGTAGLLYPWLWFQGVGGPSSQPGAEHELNFDSVLVLLFSPGLFWTVGLIMPEIGLA